MRTKRQSLQTRTEEQRTQLPQSNSRLLIARVYNIFRLFTFVMCSLLENEKVLQVDFDLCKIYSDAAFNRYPETALAGAFRNLYLGAVEGDFRLVDHPSQVAPWTVRDSVKYIGLLEQIKEAIDALHAVTSSDDVFLAEKSLTSMIMAGLNISDLELVESSGLAGHDQIAGAATVQLRRIRH